MLVGEEEVGKKKKKTKSVLGLSSLILRTGQAENSLGTNARVSRFPDLFHTDALEFWDKTFKCFEA